MKKIGILLLIMIIFVTGCSNETRVATDLVNFEKVGEKNNFTVSDNSDSYVSHTYINDSRMAVYNDVTVEMIVYDTADNASKVLNEHIDSFNLLKSTGASEKKDKGENYYKYVLISNGYYMISSRVDNTLIFCKTSLNNKSMVENLFNELGY